MFKNTTTIITRISFQTKHYVGERTSDWEFRLSQETEGDIVDRVR